MVRNYFLQLRLVEQKFNIIHITSIAGTGNRPYEAVLGKITNKQVDLRIS